MRQERELALHRVLKGLPEHYRQVIEWHHQERLSFEAIAGRLGVSAEAAQGLGSGTATAARGAGAGP